MSGGGTSEASLPVGFKGEKSGKAPFDILGLSCTMPFFTLFFSLLKVDRLEEVQACSQHAPQITDMIPRCK